MQLREVPTKPVSRFVGRIYRRDNFVVQRIRLRRPPLMREVVQSWNASTARSNARYCGGSCAPASPAPLPAPTQYRRVCRIPHTNKQRCGPWNSSTFQPLSSTSAKLDRVQRTSQHGHLEDFALLRSSARLDMRLFIVAVVAVIISGCAGAGSFTDIATLEKGPIGRTWAQEALEPRGGE